MGMRFFSASFFVFNILAVLSCIALAYADDRSVVKVNGLKESYKLAEQINFEVESLSQEDQDFICSVEKLIGTEWQEIIYHCDANTPLKATMLYSLASQGSAIIIWEPQKEKDTKIMDGTYRFRLDVVGPLEFSQVVYSQSFELE